jgi:hypothetical protein
VKSESDLGILTGVGTKLVDVVTGVLSARHEHALEISAARNLVNSGGIATEPR